MSRYKNYRGLRGETIPVLAASIATRDCFPIAEFADKIASEPQREALSYFCMEHDYPSVQNYAAAQLRRFALGLEARAAPPRYGR